LAWKELHTAKETAVLQCRGAVGWPLRPKDGDQHGVNETRPSAPEKKNSARREGSSGRRTAGHEERRPSKRSTQKLAPQPEESFPLASGKEASTMGKDAHSNRPRPPVRKKGGWPRKIRFGRTGCKEGRNQGEKGRQRVRTRNRINTRSRSSGIAHGKRVRTGGYLESCGGKAHPGRRRVWKDVPPVNAQKLGSSSKEEEVRSSCAEHSTRRSVRKKTHVTNTLECVRREKPTPQQTYPGPEVLARRTKLPR